MCITTKGNPTELDSPTLKASHFWQLTSDLYEIMWGIIAIFLLFSMAAVSNAGRLVLEAPDPADLSLPELSEDAVTESVSNDRPTKVVRFTTHQVERILLFVLQMSTNHAVRYCSDRPRN
jgi:hypothetical protein